VGAALGALIPPTILRWKSSLAHFGWTKRHSNSSRPAYGLGTTAVAWFEKALSTESVPSDVTT